MNDRSWKAVSVNFGGAFPTNHAGAVGPEHWARQHMDQYDLVFAQEVPGGDWLRERTGFHVFTHAAGQRYRTLSALLVRTSIGLPLTPPQITTARYHGSYLAAARVEHPTLGPVCLMSVHASPKRVSDAWEKEWTACGVELPESRSCGRWDADLLLATVRRVASEYQVIAAGDWNEARAWDDEHPDGGGEEFFERVGAGNCLVDVCCGRKDGPATRGALRLDHVFASQPIRAAVHTLGLGTARPTDHWPVEFTIG